MKSVTAHSKILETDNDCVQRLLENWLPQSFNLDEKEQERALYSWLKQSLPDVPIITQYGIAKARLILLSKIPISSS